VETADGEDRVRPHLAKHRFGFGGLAAAAMMAKDGWQVTVLEKNSLLPSGGTPAEYRAFVADQIQQWTKVAKENHIEPEQ
jgi:heterodisulfide reductase subunit A-like polyferredoxin